MLSAYVYLEKNILNFSEQFLFFSERNIFLTCSWQLRVKCQLTQAAPIAYCLSLYLAKVTKLNINVLHDTNTTFHRLTALQDLNILNNMQIEA